MGKIKAPSWVVLSPYERVLWIGRRSLRSMMKLSVAMVLFFILSIASFVLFPLIEPFVEEYILSRVSIPVMFIRIGLSGILFLIGLILLIKIMLIRISNEYVLTTKEIYVKKGIFSRKIDTIDLNWIKGVEIIQTPLGRLLNYGTIEILAPGADKKGITLIRIDGVADPIGVKRLIEKAMMKLTEIKEIEEELIRLREKFDIGEIDEKTYKEMKAKLEKELEKILLE